MSFDATLLIFGNDATLLNTRGWVLEKAGFQVMTVASMAEAKTIMTRQPVGLFLLCHSLSSDERQTALALVRTLQPAARCLVMMTNAQEAGLEEIEGTTIHVFAGAERLIAATRKLLPQIDTA